jgi:hypothetical protein
MRSNAFAQTANAPQKYNRARDTTTSRLVDPRRRTQTTAAQVSYASTRIQAFVVHQADLALTHKAVGQHQDEEKVVEAAIRPATPRKSSFPHSTVSLVLMTVLHYANLCCNVSLMYFYSQMDDERLLDSTTGFEIPYTRDFLYSYRFCLTFLATGTVFGMINLNSYGSWQYPVRGLLRLNLLHQAVRSFKDGKITETFRKLKIAEVFFEVCMRSARLSCFSPV